jgi:very-short-patch-repair endonuclease
MLYVPEALKRGPFSVAEAEACGIRRQRLRRPNFTRLARGVYLWSGLAREPNRELAALCRSLPPGSAFSGLTAPRIRGLDLAPDAPTEVTVPPEAAGRTRLGLKVRRGILGPQDVIKVDGMPVTSAIRTWFDLARHQPLIEAVAALDWALHRRLVSPSELTVYLEAHARWNGVRQVRKVLDHAEPKSESLMESRTRMRLMLGGLPRPEVQVEIRDPDSTPSARLDFYYPAAKLGIEFDGDHHRASLVEDNRRQNALLVRFGIRLLRFTSSDVYRRPEAMVAQVRQALVPDRQAPPRSIQARACRPGFSRAAGCPAAPGRGPV